MDWIPFAVSANRGSPTQHGELDERSLVRKGNVAYAAGARAADGGRPGGAEWFRRAAACWRESWQGGESWGRPIGALKASLLAGDEAAAEEHARWTLELGAEAVESPIGRYAAALALLVLGRWADARHVAESLRDRDDFPHDVADVLAYISARTSSATRRRSSRSSRASRRETEFLEDARVADTALVLDLLARRRGIELELPASAVLP